MLGGMCSLGVSSSLNVKVKISSVGAEGHGGDAPECLRFLEHPKHSCLSGAESSLQGGLLTWFSLVLNEHILRPARISKPLATPNSNSWRIERTLKTMNKIVQARIKIPPMTAIVIWFSCQRRPSLYFSCGCAYRSRRLWNETSRVC